MTDNVKTLTQLKTKYHADVVEWCPDTNFQDYFLSGTYQLQDCENLVGNITVGHLLLHDEASEQYSLENYVIENISGVFDMKWKPNNENNEPIFAVAFANGSVVLYRVTFGENSVKNVESVFTKNLAEIVQKPLAVEWNNHKKNFNSPSLIVSDACGYLHNLSIENQNLDHIKWQAHAFEAWTTLFDIDDPNIVYSGGDDNLFKSWDLRTNLSSPVFLNKRHSMGVTSIVKNREVEHLLATGSYDEHIYLWDIRQMKQNIANMRIEGGGIWKIKWHPFMNNYLVVAAMHEGFHVLKLNNCDFFTTETSYRKHDSLAYGVDWCRKPTGSSEAQRIASCSFYDNLLHIWEVQLKT